MDHVENNVANRVQASDVYSRADGRDDPDPDPGSGTADLDNDMSREERVGSARDERVSGGHESAWE